MSLPAVAALLSALLLPAFDKVLLKDGRTVEGTVVPGTDPAVTQLRIGTVEVPIRNELIDRTWIENLEGYVPRNEQEAEYLRKGMVLFEGSWMSRTRRESELRDRAEAEKAALARALERQDWAQAVVEETRHFIVTSNCTDDVRHECATDLEAYYDSFTEDWGIRLSPGELRGKLKVQLYRSRDDFLAHTHQLPGVNGFFSRARGELQLFHDVANPEEWRDTLFHEANHLLTWLIDTSFVYPIWLNEGMAEYYGTAEIDAKGRFQVGALQYGRIVSLRTDRANNQFLRLRDVLLAGHVEYSYRHYAYGWSFVHFMMTSPRYAKAFRSFFSTLPRNGELETRSRTWPDVPGAVREPEPESVLAALEKRFDKSVEELESEWLHAIEQSYGELPATAWYKAGLLALRYPRTDGSNVRTAMENLEKAVALGIQDPHCYRDYAELLRKGGVLQANDASAQQRPDPARALVMVRKAIELDPIDPFNYTEAAGILMLDGPVQDLEQAHALCETALAVGGQANVDVRILVDELLGLIDPVLARRRAAAGGPTGGEAAGSGTAAEPPAGDR